VFGPSGILNIGGGTLSADTTLKLYAPGSSGTLNFMSDVTLSSGTAIHLAANTVTIQPMVIVHILGAGGAANVYTTNANYSGFGGTNPSNGTFDGNGANLPQPLSNAPPFGNPPSSRPAVATASPGGTPRTADQRVIGSVNVANSSQLLSLLDAASSSGGKTTSSALGNLNHLNAHGRSIASQNAADVRHREVIDSTNNSPHTAGANRLENHGSP